MKYKHLSQKERDQIYDLSQQGYKKSKIGVILDRDPATIGREMRRNATSIERRLNNSPKKKKHYLPDRAQGKYDLAVVRYRLALGVQSSPDIWKALGDLYTEMGDSFKAQNAFQMAIAIDPKTEEAHIQLGIFYLGQKRFDEATTEFQKTIEINPKNEKAYFSLGTLKMEKGELPEALDSFQRAKAINPTDANTLYNLGLVYLKIGNNDQAEKEWAMILTIDPHYPRALYNLGLLNAKRSDLKKAGQYYCQFLEAAKGNFPTEEALAGKAIEENNVQCQK